MKKNIKSWIYSLVVIGSFLMLTDSCKKSDDNVDSGISSGTVKDIDGNVYNTVTIGTQVWMVENLKTTKYRDGSPILYVADFIQLYKLTSGVYCNYNNDATIGAKYGKLYNWHAVSDSRNIAPTGWHVATDAEWSTLDNYVDANLGASINVGKALASKTNWAASTYERTIGNDLSKNNSSGFTGLPGGYLHYAGSFNSIGEDGTWWSSTADGTKNAWSWSLEYAFGFVHRSSDYKENGYSVRCVKD
jgi:uncharacterized protein (TIGR02145 family)